MICGPSVGPTVGPSVGITGLPPSSVVWSEFHIEVLIFGSQNEICRNVSEYQNNIKSPYTGGVGIRSLSSAGSCCHSSVRRGTSPRSSLRPLPQGGTLHWALPEPSWGSPETSYLSRPSQLENQTYRVPASKRLVRIWIYFKQTLMLFFCLHSQLLSLVRPIQMLCFLV